MLKQNRAITLISLIIAVIVLLILAGVSINFIFGNDGIFNRTQSAVDKYKQAQDYEETEIGKMNNQINNYVSGNRDYTPINYSTKEQDTGIKWIDGKPIYQSTYYYAEQLTTKKNNLFQLQTDIDYIIEIKGTCYRDNYNKYLPINYCDNGPSCLIYMPNLNSGYIELYRENFGSEPLSKFSATILYTKTTD